MTVCALGLGLASVAFGDTATTPQAAPVPATQPAPNTAANTTQQAPQPHVYYCPPASVLKHKGASWYAPGWRTSDAYASFATKIQGFIGAEWTGTNVGKISCIYQGTEAGPFPIALDGNALIGLPSGGNWDAPKKGLTRCASNNPLNCPFIAVLQKARDKSGAIPYYYKTTPQERSKYLWLNQKIPTLSQ